MRTAHAVALLVSVGVIVAAAAAGCGGNPRQSIIDDNGLEGGVGIESGPGFGPGGDSGAACLNLQCQQTNCGGGGDTTVTGTVYAPNGTLPLYNAIVYVPNSMPDALTHGATCDKCGAVTGAPLVTALSDATGKFTLQNVPSGKNIPLVIQIGKWRRQVVIPEVTACTENALTDHELTRLPRKQSEGDIPHMALTTGGCDQLGCMLPKVGIDPSEFGLDSDGPSKAIHVYNGNSLNGNIGPGAANSARPLWNDPMKLKTYDLVLLSCECEEAREGGSFGGNPSKGAPAFAAMTDYLTAGGRIFTTDFMYTWYKFSPDAALAGAASIPGGAPPGGSPITIDTTFPKGKALGDWLATVTPGSNNKVTPDVVFSNIASTDTMKTQQWATSGAPSPGPRVFSVNVPVGVPADQQCGKGLHIDAHLNNNSSLGGTGNDVIDPSYPAGCASSLKEGEKLLAFFFFDLASCIQNETEAPKPPQVK
ncbi:MAG: hypothetical protein QOI41_335 [Myxococcales bacterium]|nr:hypothetical protein [Myxococcales bacterium]